ncbi:DUF1338 domain-containing protein [Nostoc sp. FACHB-87]|uniref:DUF1338 domain-containing protein n=1 Tax=Nostocaceae TaxID=1162 RepID=UPI001685EDA0|nr:MULTISPECIES: DUF1338 domain-containing protein [Nostocaceae]MBD2300230.1 DUF1338 domain-containing protein [Nostoc sp. FACHB-190]MBD2456512.1 DUF1338 domain-containing protein [Nostoc sp. FACHB-87]MBD2477163.1 DUF1338 domain-containing protein [Anabaena sp. FACHB-83]
MNPELASYLWEALWQEYKARVNYAQIYQNMITNAGGTVANDHIAFRSLRLLVDTPQGKINLGINHLGQIATALGYEVAGEYTFTATHLYARHYQHPQAAEFDLPKLFISELIVDELPENIAQLIYQTVSKIPHPTLSSLTPSFSDEKQLKQIFSRPWQIPRRSVVEEVNKITQYGAWVLLHGYAVNHFTGYINRQNTPAYPDIDTTADALVKLGVPMKAEIEGDVTCGLRQTATHAVSEMVTVLDDNSQAEIQIPWTYAYYELAQRYIVESEPGKPKLFQAFLGKNAQHLFEMTSTTRQK